MKAYVSHSIRGPKGAEATHAEMMANNAKAIAFAARLREACPGLDLYVPGEHDLFVMLAYTNGYITEDQILNVDKQILAKQDMLIVYSPDGYLGGGVGVELEEAKRLGMPYVVTDGSLDPVRSLVEDSIV